MNYFKARSLSLQLANSSLSYLSSVMRLLGHVGKGFSKVLLAEGQLADGPDLGVLRSMLVTSSIDMGDLYSQASGSS